MIQSISNIRHVVFQYDYVEACRGFRSWTLLKQSQLNCMIYKVILNPKSGCGCCDFNECNICNNRNFFRGLL